MELAGIAAGLVLAVGALVALAGLALHGWVIRRPGLPGDVMRRAARLAGWPGRRAGPRWARLLGGLGPDQMDLALTIVLGLPWSSWPAWAWARWWMT